MTEKRFTKCDTKIRDNGEEMTQAEVRDMLNKLHDENEQLRKDATTLIYANQDYRHENEQLKSEIEKLSYANEDLLEEKRIWKQMSDEYTKLSDENGQLKNKIDVLEDDNETYHKSLEKLNLYTKRFIPTKCTNEFKDCKTNRYYWLDHEGNFKGCLELLNLLDCENEVLKSENSQLKGRLMEYEEQIKGDME